MLNMESYLASMALGEESLQMWDLNKRLEVYLSRVKSLEEENEFLRAEIQSLKGNQVDKSWRTKYEEEINALRATLEESFSKKSQVEMARDNLYEEIQYVKSRCQKEKLAQEEAKKELLESKKILEEEGRAQIWLKEKATQLEKELETLLEVHEQEKSGLEQEMVTFSQRLENFRVVPVTFHPVEVEDYSKQLSEIWKGAVETYKNEVSVLEVNLSEAKEKLWKVAEEKSQNQLQLQKLEKELLSLKMQKDVLEEHLSKDWQNQRQEAEKFQSEIELLEQEKQNLRVQIAQILEDRQQLMHLKMSLSLEVATYRTLLEAESTRLQMPAADYKATTAFREAKKELGSSKLQTVVPEARRSVSREYRLSSTPVQREERRPLPKKAPNAFLSIKPTISPKGGSPVTREFQKVNSVLQSHSLKYTSVSGLKKDAAIKTEYGQEPPRTDEVITKAKVESTSKLFSQSLPQVGSETERLPSPETVSYSEREQAETGLEVKAHQTLVEEFHKDIKEFNKDDQEEQFNNETMPLSVTQLVTETLEAAMKTIKESDGEFKPFHSFAPDIKPGSLKAKEASCDLSSYDQEINGNSPSVKADTHVEMIQEEHVQGYDSQMPTSISASTTDPKAEASDAAASDQGHNFENWFQEADTGNSKELESSYLEKGEKSMKEQDSTKQKIEAVLDIPFTIERCETNPSEDVISSRHAAFDKEEPNLLSTENYEESEVISSYVVGSLSEHFKMPQETERDSHDMSTSDQDGPSSVEVGLEKFDRKETEFELSTTEMSEGEKAEELASILQGNDFESQNEVQESELLKVGMQAGEDVKYHESFFADTEEKLSHVNGDNVSIEQDQESKLGKLPDKEDIGFENATDITEVTSEQNIESQLFFADTEENLSHVNGDNVSIEQDHESKLEKLADKESIEFENATYITEVTSDSEQNIESQSFFADTEENLSHVNGDNVSIEQDHESKLGKLPDKEDIGFENATDITEVTSEQNIESQSFFADTEENLSHDNGDNISIDQDHESKLEKLADKEGIDFENATDITEVTSEQNIESQSFFADTEENLSHVNGDKVSIEQDHESKLGKLPDKEDIGFENATDITEVISEQNIESQSFFADTEENLSHVNGDNISIDQDHESKLGKLADKEGIDFENATDITEVTSEQNIESQSFFADTEEKLSHVNGDNVSIEQDQESKLGKLADKEDIDFENATDITEVTSEQNIESQSLFADTEEKLSHVNGDNVSIEQDQESKLGKLADKEGIDFENATDITEVTSEQNIESQSFFADTEEKLSHLNGDNLSIEQDQEKKLGKSADKEDIDFENATDITEVTSEQNIESQSLFADTEEKLSHVNGDNVSIEQDQESKLGKLADKEGIDFENATDITEVTSEQNIESQSFFADTEEKLSHLNGDNLSIEQDQEKKLGKSADKEDIDFENATDITEVTSEQNIESQSLFADTEEKLSHVNGDNVSIEQDQESKLGKLADKEDIGFENATDITEVTSQQNAESLFVQETLDTTKDNTEGHENVELEEDIVGQENQTETSNILEYEDLRVETVKEKENTDLREDPFGQDIMGHETLSVEANAMKLEVIGNDEGKENCERWLPTEIDSKREDSKQDHSETEKNGNFDLSYETTGEDPSEASRKRKDHPSDMADNLDSELRVVSDKEDVQEYAEEKPPTDDRNPVQEMETNTSFVQDAFLEEYMDITREYKEDQSPSVQDVKETSVLENSEEQMMALDESKKTEQCKDMPTGLEIQEELPEVQKLGDSALTSIAYQIKNEYSDPEDSAESQEDVSLNEFQTIKIKEQELEISKEYILDQTLPDTTPLPTFDDEKVDIDVAVTEEDVYLCTEGAIDFISTSEEFPISLQGTQDQIDPMTSQTTLKVEEDVVDEHQSILNRNIDNAGHIPFDHIHYQEIHDLEGSEASDNSLIRDESTAQKDDRNTYSKPNFSETTSTSLYPEMSPDKVIGYKQNEEEAYSLDAKSDDEVEIVLEEAEDNEESKVRESYPEVSEQHDLECKQDDFSKEHVLMYGETDDVEIVKESSSDLNYSSCVEAESIQSVSAPGTLEDILQRDETLQENEKEETVIPGSENSVSSVKEEESLSVTRIDCSSELDLDIRGLPDGKNGLGASQCNDDRNALSSSQELEEKSSSENMNDYDPLPREEQASDFHTDALSSSDISNQSDEAEHPAQDEDIVTDQQQSLERGTLQEQVVQHIEKALLSEMEFAVENNSAENNNTKEQIVLHTEMLNGYSYLEQSKNTTVDDQRSTEKRDGDIMSTPGVEEFAETVLTQELDKDKIFLFPTSEVKSDGLFQTLLETSDKEAKRLDEVLFLASDDEENQHRSGDNRGPEAEGTEDDLSNIIDTPYAKGKYVRDQHLRTETNQHGSETLAGPGAEFHPENEDSWSSEDD
uniref:Nestin n=1 Tax=Geotrypetes seraphini TaxID=260995 RepID=A0A6P8PUN6_GEOSA|nr:nestin [Geotrypetes seraphini]